MVPVSDYCQTSSIYIYIYASYCCFFPAYLLHGLDPRSFARDNLIELSSAELELIALLWDEGIKVKHHFADVHAVNFRQTHAREVFDAIVSKRSKSQRFLLSVTRLNATYPMCFSKACAMCTAARYNVMPWVLCKGWSSWIHQQSSPLQSMSLVYPVDISYI